MKRTMIGTSGLILIAAVLAAVAATDAVKASPPALHFTEYTGVIRPGAITLGPDGALWCTYYLGPGGGVARITTAGAVTLYPAPTYDTSEITTGPDGALWYTVIPGGLIVRMTTSGVYTQYSLPSPHAPYDIITASSNALWFTDSGLDQFGNFLIGRITTAGAITEYPVPQPPGYSVTASYHLAHMPGGGVWFDTVTPSGFIGQIATGGTMVIPTMGQPGDIAGGPDGGIWGVGNSYGEVWRFATDGTTTSYPIRYGGSSIILGPDGAMWVAEGDRLGRVTTSGIVTEYLLPPGGDVEYLTVGPDRAIWFTEHLANKIGRFGR